MLTFATAIIFTTLVIVNYKEKASVTIDLSLMLAAMLGDVIIAFIIFW